MEAPPKGEEVLLGPRDIAAAAGLKALVVVPRGGSWCCAFEEDGRDEVEEEEEGGRGAGEANQLSRAAAFDLDCC